MKAPQYSLDKIITAFLAVTIFVLLPFFYSVRLQDVEQSPRFLGIAVIVLLASLMTLVMVMKGKVFLRTEKIPLFFIGYLAINFFSYFKTGIPGDWWFEFLKLCLFGSLLLLFLILLGADEKNERVFMKTIVVSAIIFIVIGAFQLYPVVADAFRRNVTLKIDYSIASSLGNKNFYSEVIFMMLPMVLLLSFFKQSFWRILAITTSAFILTVIVINQTLSTWVALFASVFVMVMLLFWFRKKLFVTPKAASIFYKSVMIASFALVLSVVVFISVAGTTQIRSRVAVIEKLFKPGAITEEANRENSIYERIIIWKNSLKLIATHPVTGVGLGNWKIEAPAYGMERSYYLSSGGIRVVHPHNDFLLIFSETGLIGLILFLGFLLSMIYYSWVICIRSEQQKDILFGITMIASLTGYILISMVSMPIYRFYPFILLMLYAAMIVSRSYSNKAGVKIISRQWLIIMLITMFVSASAAAIIGNKRIKSDFNLSAALIAERKNNLGLMMRHLNQVDKKAYPIDVTATPVAWYHGFVYFHSGDRDKAFELFKEAEMANPNHLMVLNDLGTCYNLSGDAATAKSYYLKALEIQPNYGDALINLAIIYYNSSQTDSAFSTLLNFQGKMKKESVPVFRTIFEAQAKNLTTDSLALSKFGSRLNTQPAIIQLIKEISTNDSGIKGVLSGK